mmetsp:Transcript_2865/g.7576  ORF Transcript_2865/g.7576 Transcript_2865/m.7576 type:complete len:90 (+) Transcript_2865:815-1084(+)
MCCNHRHLKTSTNATRQPKSLTSQMDAAQFAQLFAISIKAFDGQKTTPKSNLPITFGPFCKNEPDTPAPKIARHFHGGGALTTHVESCN